MATETQSKTASQKVTSQIVWFDIPATDIDRAIAFYNRVMGFSMTKDEFGGGAIGVFPHSAEENKVGGCVYKTEDNKPSDHGPLLYLNVDGRLKEAVKLAEENGGKVLQPIQEIPPHGFRAIIRDSEGNRVALWSMQNV